VRFGLLTKKPNALPSVKRRARPNYMDKSRVAIIHLERNLDVRVCCHNANVTVLEKINVRSFTSAVAVSCNTEMYFFK
jgi:hypothetical protein